MVDEVGVVTVEVGAVVVEEAEMEDDDTAEDALGEVVEETEAAVDAAEEADVEEVEEAAAVTEGVVDALAVVEEVVGAGGPICGTS